MRLFIAIPTTKDFNKKIEKELKSVQQTLKGKDIRYRHPDKWYITLIFLGEQNEESIDAIKKGIRNVAKTIKPFDIEMEEIKYMPSYREPSMIWMTTKEEASLKLGSIKGKVAKELERLAINWKRNKRTYKGHITLARFKPEKENPLPNIRKEVNLKFKTSSIQLVKSELSPEGAKYTTLEEFNL